MVGAVKFFLTSRRFLLSQTRLGSAILIALFLRTQGLGKVGPYLRIYFFMSEKCPQQQNREVSRNCCQLMSSYRSLSLSEPLVRLPKTFAAALPGRMRCGSGFRLILARYRPAVED